MSNLFYDKEEQDTLTIPVEEEQYTVTTGTAEDSVVTVDNTEQKESILIPSPTQSVLLTEGDVKTQKAAIPTGNFVTVNTPQTVTGDKDFTGQLTHNGVPVATVEDIDTSNLVDLNSYQLIDGVKVFNEQFGVRNKSNGEINLIKHINNNFLITENNGTNILNIDEQLKAMYLYNKKIATEEYVDAKAMEAGSGTVVHVDGVAKADIYFDEDPQTQLNNKVDTQYINENLPIIVDNLVSNKGFIDKNVDNLAHYYDKDYIDNNIYDKTEVEQRIPTALSHLTDDVGYLTTEADPTVPAWAKTTNKPDYRYDEILNKPSFSTVASSGSYDDLIDKPDIPSKVGDLENDAGYITGFTETDPTVPAWAKKANKPEYNYSEIGGTPDLSIYAKTTELSAKADKSALEENYYSKTATNNLLNAKVDDEELKNYYTKDTTDGLLSDKAPKSDVTNAIAESKEYTDTKIAELIGGEPGELDTIKEIVAEIEKHGDAYTALNEAVGKKVDKTTKINGKPLSSDIELNASDVGALSSNTVIPDKLPTPHKLTLWDKNPNHALIEFDGSKEAKFEIDIGGLEADIQANSDYIANLQNSVGNNTDIIAEMKVKLDNIASGAEVNVQSDWGVTDTTSDAYIKNKPTIPTTTSQLTNNSGFITKSVSNLTNYTTTNTLTENYYNKTQTDALLDDKVTKESGKGLFSGNYNDLTNKPTIPSVAGLASTSYVDNKTSVLQTNIDKKADKTELIAYAKKEDLIDYATNEDLNKVAEDILDDIPDISGLASENYVTSVANVLHERINGKQDIISDLATIRSGASAGATAVQHSALESQVSTLQGNIDKKVDKTTTINKKALSGNINLTASDVGALPSTTTLFSGNYNDLTNKPTIPTTASQVGALPDTTKYGATLSLTMNTSTYVVTAQLKDQAGNNLGTAQTIDLPLESVVVDGEYDATNKKVILTLKDGGTIGFSVADLVSGLVQDTRKVAGIDLKDDITTTELSTALNLSQYANKVTSVNNKTGAVSLSASDVGALPNTTVVPKLYNDIGENTDGAIDQATMTMFFNNIDEVFTGFENGLSSKYQKPSTGIPKTDLASAVQTSLGKADTALQSIPAEYVTETELNAKGYAKTTDLNNYLPLAGGDMTGGINYSYSGSSDYAKDEVLVNNTAIVRTYHKDGSNIPTNVYLGSSGSSLDWKGKNTRPTYNNNDLALKSDVITKTSQLENDAGFITTAPEGVALYETTGSNTDGAMTQKATTDELNKKVSKGTTLVGGQLAQYTTSGTLETTGITPTDVMTLSTAQTVSGAKSFNANNHLIATCNTAYSSTTKTASLTGFTSNHFTDGCEIYVKFVNGNTAGSRTSPVTLNVNSAGAKTMVVAESATLGSYNQNINLFGQWANNDVIKFRYDATYNYWVAVENVTQHKLYGFANTTLYSTTGTSETTGMTQKAITDALSGKANTSDIPDISNLATKDEIPDITGKADKVSGATEGNIAKLDADGNLVDSGILNSSLVIKSGTNTMSGTYVITGTTRIKSTAQDVTTAPSSTQYKYIDFYDKNNSRVGLVGSQIRSDGYFGMYFQAENKASLGVLTNTTDYKLIATPLSKSVTNSGATKSYLTEALTGAGTLKIYHGTFTPSSGYCTITFAVPFTNASTISAFAEIRTIADSSAATAPRVSAISTTSVTFYSNRVKGTSSAVNDVAHSYFIIGY